MFDLDPQLLLALNEAKSINRQTPYLSVFVTTSATLSEAAIQALTALRIPKVRSGVTIYTATLSADEIENLRQISAAQETPWIVKMTLSSKLRPLGALKPPT